MDAQRERSRRLRPARPRRWVATTLKMLVMPIVACTAGTVFGLVGHALLGVVIMAGLPTAQNIFLHATPTGPGKMLPARPSS